MKVAYLDAGNTRLKYSICQDDDVLNGIVDYGNLSLLNDLLARADRVYISMVGKECRKQQIMTSLESLCVTVIRVTSENMKSLVSTDYLQPDLMGVDRWLAIYSVLSDFEGYSMVVDAGTALTIDVLYGAHHKGGYIVPGYFAQLDSMVTSAALPDVVGQGQDVSLGVDTASCMRHGVWMQLSSFVSAVVARYPGVNLHITGGDAQVLAGLISYPSNVHDNLVLDGLIKFGLRVDS